MKEQVKWAQGLLEKYPKTKELMSKWALSEIGRFQESILSELQGQEITIPEITQEMAEQYCQVLLTANQYGVLDFLDSEHYYVNLNVHETSVSRKELTKRYIEIGFEILNSK